MSTTQCFLIVGRNDCPLYEAELGSAPRVRHKAVHHFRIYVMLRERIDTSLDTLTSEIHQFDAQLRL